MKGGREKGKRKRKIRRKKGENIEVGERRKKEKKRGESLSSQTQPRSASGRSEEGAKRCRKHMQQQQQVSASRGGNRIIPVSYCPLSLKNF